VLAIITVLAAVQLPRLNALLAKSALRSEAKTLERTMLTARTKAVMERREVRLYFDEGPAKYWVEEQGDPVNAPDAYLRPTGGPLGRPVRLTTGIEFGRQTAGSRVRFLPDGQVDGEKVRLLDKKGRFAELAFEGVTDKVRVTYGKIEQGAWGSAD